VQSVDKKMNNNYSCAIIGGGLGGLCLAIQLAQHGVETILFEKNSYPQHKVCGEYISMESWHFLTELGVDLEALHLPKINQLGVSAENGFMLESPLDLGGFGISRHSLDHCLAQIARKNGVKIIEDCKVNDVQQLRFEELETPQYSMAKTDKLYQCSYAIATSRGDYFAQIVCGSFGKYAPSFAKLDGENTTKRPNYIGVKYHIQTDLAANRIELHNFKDGYCGISKVDNDRFCLCYLSDSKNLQQSGNNLKTMEETILYKNPFLKRYFTQSDFLFPKPLVISNIYFHKKESYHNGIFMLGDAAGAITPLCGNGMSMAMRASKLLANLLYPYFVGKLTKNQLIQQYSLAWKSNFNARIWVGRHLQHYVFGKKTSTQMALKALHYFPSLTRKIIGLTHGQPF
jgi:2-polyprenyl-6-methoxyphenol hydroxylase-like FAD-dependent oxidoreductase